MSRSSSPIVGKHTARLADKEMQEQMREADILEKKRSSVRNITRYADNILETIVSRGYDQTIAEEIFMAIQMRSAGFPPQLRFTHDKAINYINRQMERRTNLTPEEKGVILENVNMLESLMLGNDSNGDCIIPSSMNDKEKEGFVVTQTNYTLTKKIRPAWGKFVGENGGEDRADIFNENYRPLSPKKSKVSFL